MTRLYHDIANNRWIWRLPWVVRKSLDLPETKEISRDPKERQQYEVDVLEFHANTKTITIRIREINK